MRFQKDVSKELRKILLKDFSCYIKAVSMSTGEYAELCRWVQSGHSPYDNAWYITTEDGHPMDYINALRLVETEATASHNTMDEDCTPIYNTTITALLPAFPF